MGVVVTRFEGDPGDEQPEAQCVHPPADRWQEHTTWICCSCGSRFWGDKQREPAADVYGRKQKTAS